MGTEEEELKKAIEESKKTMKEEASKMKEEHKTKNNLMSSARVPQELPELSKEKKSGFEEIHIDENDLVLMTEELKEPVSKKSKKRKPPTSNSKQERESQSLYSELVLRTEDSGENDHKTREELIKRGMAVLNIG